MISTVDGFTYLDAVLALVPLAKIVPSNDGSYENAEWLDERIAPTANAVSEKLIELKAVETFGGCKITQLPQNKLRTAKRSAI
jgi:hypothetical protein